MLFGVYKENGHSLVMIYSLFMTYSFWLQSSDMGIFITQNAFCSS